MNIQSLSYVVVNVVLMIMNQYYGIVKETKNNKFIYSNQAKLITSISKCLTM